MQTVANYSTAGLLVGVEFYFEKCCK